MTFRGLSETYHISEEDEGIVFTEKNTGIVRGRKVTKVSELSGIYVGVPGGNEVYRVPVGTEYVITYEFDDASRKRHNIAYRIGTVPCPLSGAFPMEKLRTEQLSKGDLTGDIIIHDGKSFLTSTDAEGRIVLTQVQCVYLRTPRRVPYILPDMDSRRLRWSALLSKGDKALIDAVLDNGPFFTIQQYRPVRLGDCIVEEDNSLTVFDPAKHRTPVGHTFLSFETLYFTEISEGAAAIEKRKKRAKKADDYDDEDDED